jgi:hypothetical protein
MATVNPAYLIPYIRLMIGDTNPDSFRYLNEWLEVALQSAIKSSWFNNKYTIDGSGLVSRNLSTWFPIEEPPVLLQADERPIVLLAAVTILEGSLENSAWNLATWRDNEISFSNLEGGRVRDANLQRLWNELLSLVQQPTKKLVGTLKGSLPGYLNNDYEKDTKY